MSKRLALLGAGIALLGIILGNIGLSSAASPKAAGVQQAWGRDVWSGNAQSGASVGIESHEGGETLVVTTRELNFKEINVNGPGFGPGDYFIFNERVFQSGRQIGVDNGQCTAHFPLDERRFTFLCEVSFTYFGRGEIMTEGRIQFTPETTSLTLPITGGTKHFQNVRGEIHVGGENQTVITFHLLP